MSQAHNHSTPSLFAAMTGALLLLSACAASSQTTSPTGFATNTNLIETAVQPASSAVSNVALGPAAPSAGGVAGLADDSGISDPSSSADANFKGCWYKTKKARYQAVEISVGIPGTYPFNALLYHGTTCDTNDYADQFGYGDPLTLGNGTYVFWFSAFKNDENMSALWYLGDQTSTCMVYTASTPTC
jgi:hypothetical protein